jgi:23S rRNA (cytidine1920-2'-O)/16S rRNA (cytidine1409-2'-O)-methyltransferase
MIVALFKPQYEIEDKTLLKKGIVRSDEAREGALGSFRDWLEANDWEEAGFMESPIRGSGGNIEFLFHLKPST